MSGPKIEFLSAVLIVSKNPERLARFYRDVIGIPLEDEQHDETEPHWGCTLGDIHFAIHPISDFPDDGVGDGAVKLAFTVFDMEAFVKRLSAHDMKSLYPPKDEGFYIITALRDPDGNYLEFTQFSEAWIQHLEERKSQGLDIVVRWKATKS